VWNTKCYSNKEFIFCSRNLVMVYMNNEIPKALVFNALIPTWVYFLSIPVVGNPVLLIGAKISYRVNPLEILIICLVLYEQRDYESTSPRNSYFKLGSTFKYSVTVYTVT